MAKAIALDAGAFLALVPGHTNGYRLSRSASRRRVEREPRFLAPIGNAKYFSSCALVQRHFAARSGNNRAAVPVDAALPVLQLQCPRLLSGRSIRQFPRKRTAVD